MPELSIVVPAYNEAQNLPVFYERVRAKAEALGLDWEWIVVDDHSADETFAVAAGLAARDPRVKAARLARNSGSHTAILCGLHRAQGKCAVVMAADLQDPPETVEQLLEAWRGGAQVVWAVRRERKGEGLGTRLFARMYYALMRGFVGLRDMPSTGADLVLIDRAVIDALRQFHEVNVSLLALITWMGFRQASISYDKEARLHGVSGWSLKKKLKMAVDSVTSFTYAPIRLISYAGMAVALAGFVYALFIVIYRLRGGTPASGWASLMVVILVLGGLQMIMMGVLGEYLWRALDEARRRPPYLIEALTPNLLPGNDSGSTRGR